MTADSGAVLNRWRRFDDALATVAEHRHSAAPHAVPDAVARALDALYDLAGLVAKSKALEARAEQDPRGRTTVALVNARGGKTHDLMDHGALLGFDEAPFGLGPFGGGWMWRPYVDEKRPLRSQWFAERVEWQAVLIPFTDAAAWLAEQPELAR